MLTGNEIREKFIEFFESKNHKHFESASLIPDDPDFTFDSSRNGSI